MVQQNYF